MKNILIILCLCCIFVSCNNSIKIITKTGEETEFQYKGVDSLLLGDFDSKKSELMWNISSDDIIKCENIIQECFDKNMTKKYDPDTDKYQDVSLDKNQVEYSKKSILNSVFNVYTITSNNNYERLINLSYFTNKTNYKKDYPELTILVSISEKWIKIKENSY